FTRWEALSFLSQRLENLAMDWRFQVRGEQATPEVNMVYANVDSPTMLYWGERPFPRADFARLIQVLFEYGKAEAVGVDFVFSEASHSPLVTWEMVRAHDDMLAKRLREYPNTVIGAFYSGTLLPETIEELQVDEQSEILERRTRHFPYLRNQSDTEPAPLTFPEMPTFPLVPKVGGATIGLIDIDVVRNAGPELRWVPVFSYSKGPYEPLNLLAGFFYALGIENKDEYRKYVEAGDANMRVFNPAGEQVGQLPLESERTFYTMALELALITLGRTHDDIVITGSALTVYGDDNKALLTIPLTDGQVVESNWFSTWENRELNPAASVRIILQQAINLEEGDAEMKADAERFFNMFNDAVVFVGPTDPLLQDLATTPLNSDPVPKVSMHGNLYKTIMTGEYIRRLPPGIDLVILLALTFLVAYLGTYTGRHSTWAKAASFAVLIAFVVGVFLAFNVDQLVVPLIIPAACAITTTTAGAVYQLLAEEKQKGRIKGYFGTYISPELVEQMVDSGRDPQLGGADETITAFFSDIQAFSTFSEVLEPKQLVELMNEYLTAMTDILQEEGGTLDKYIGDAMVAMFNAPVPIEHHAYQACRAAALIQKRQIELREKWAAEGEKWPAIVSQMHTRIGINTGHAVVGNMGSSTRFNYTMMGDNVNLAARCESGAKSAGVYTLVSEETRNQAMASSQDILFRYLDKWQVKGRSQPVNMYEVVGLREDLKEDAFECVRRYEQALKLYFARDWAAAQQAFETAATLEPFQPERDAGVTINPSRLMAKRCAMMLLNPPAEDWDGVYVMTTK
ncbi:MAG: adenylate/guanylate cyclase domain-containing protein, partial [Verrucomicrobiota bacterium]